MMLAFSFIGIHMVFKNEFSVSWFEQQARKMNAKASWMYGHPFTKMTGNRFNKILFYIEGTFCLIMAFIIFATLVFSGIQHVMG
jgi:hypothetical protein